MEQNPWQGWSALGAIVLALRQRGTKLDEAAVRRDHPELADASFRWEAGAAFLKRQKYRASLHRLTFEELRGIPVPAVVRMRDGRCLMLGQHHDDAVFLFDAEQGRPLALPAARFRTAWTGEVLVFSPRLSFAAIRQKYNLDWFAAVLLRYRRALGEVLLASFFLQAMGILMPLVTQVIIDKVIGNHGVSTLTVLGVSMLVLLCLQSVLMFVRTYLLNVTTTKLDAILGTRLFRHLISLPVPYYEHRRVGDTMLRVNMMAGIREFLTGKSLTTLLDAVFSLVFLFVMFCYSVKLTLLVLVIVPVFVVQAVWFLPLYQKKMREAFGALSAQRAFLVEAVTGMTTIKALAIEPQFLHRFETYLSRCVDKTFRQQNLGLVMHGGTALLQTVSSLLVLWAGGYMVMDNRLTLGELIAFQMLAGQAVGPLVRLFSMWPDLQQTAFALQALGDILHARMEPVLVPMPRSLPVMKGSIDLHSVTFRYRPDLPPALKDITLSIRAGEKIGIVGRSGSGKSTLASLIEKIYFPDAGTITIDGRDLKTIPYPWLRRQMGVVMQDSYLFDGSVRENIAAGWPAAPMAAVIEAAKCAGAHDFILELEEGYDTRVGERGATLSGGQRQRIAIARALLTQPRILIFDEATSALDYESEREVLRNIEAIGAGRTMLIIAHRLTTVAHCDRILVVDHGTIAEQGTPRELYAAGGLYRMLCDQQGESV